MVEPGQVNVFSIVISGGAMGGGKDLDIQNKSSNLRHVPPNQPCQYTGNSDNTKSLKIQNLVNMKAEMPLQCSQYS